MTNKKQSAVTSTIEGSVVTVTVNGEAFSVDVSTISAELLQQAALHGFKQKLADGAAISRNSDTGRSATLADKADAVRTIWERITVDGNWNAVRGDGSGGSSSRLVRALMEHFKKDKATILAFLDPKSKDEKAAAAAHPPVKAIIDHMAATAAAAKVKAAGIDTDALLNDPLLKGQ